MEDKELHQLIVSEQAVSGAYHAEFGAAVEGVAGLLCAVVGQGSDESLGEGVALVEELILLGYATLDHLGTTLAIALGCETIGGDAVVDEVAHDTLCSTL